MSSPKGDYAASSLLQKCSQVSCQRGYCATSTNNGNPKQDCAQLSELQVLAWSLVGAVVFVCSWWYTGGGYSCSIPVFTACCFYCYSSYGSSSGKLGPISELVKLTENVKNNVKFLLREDKRSVVLILSYLIIKVSLVLAYPAAEKSNGSPMSLILFTVIFICTYLVPPFFTAIISSLKALCSYYLWAKNERAASYRVSGAVMLYLRHVLQWRRSLLVVAVIVVSTYLLDSELSAMLRFLGAGKPCWPLLSHKSVRELGKLPPNMISTIPWHKKFKDYKPHLVLGLVISYGRELGEVCHLLPVLIGTFMLAQLFLPPQNSQIKKAFFASIAGVVLGGVTSGIFKILFHRYRPNAYGNPYMWTGPGMTTVDHLKFSKLDLSFPAGHTTVTTAVATCLYIFISSNLKRVKVSRLVDILLLFCLYTHPVLVLVSRVSDCYHWTSDASFGVCKTIVLYGM